MSIATAQPQSRRSWTAVRTLQRAPAHPLQCTGAGLLAALCIAGCGNRNTAVLPGADPQRGAALIREVGCASCHMIPGIRGARGLVGPPLMHFSRRTYVAGRLPNTPANLIDWIRDPQAIDPATAMPTIGLDEQQARDIAAYLYTLR